jgi:threonine aldolase
MFGGGMRQVGILAAAAIYALDHHVERLAEDHANARRLADALAELPGISIDPSEVETNILYFRTDEATGTAESFCNTMRERGVWMLRESAYRVRAVTNLDVSTADIDRAISIFRDVLVPR